MDPVGYRLALGATERHVMSARPNAPVEPDRDWPPQDGPGRIRRGTAAMLRLVADRLAPAQPTLPSATTQTCTP